eukprot:scaffold44552_cov44-Phaeocystis_antarctica.AAC.1
MRRSPGAAYRAILVGALLASYRGQLGVQESDPNPNPSPHPHPTPNPYPNPNCILTGRRARRSPPWTVCAASSAHSPLHRPSLALVLALALAPTLTLTTALTTARSTDRTKASESCGHVP